MSPPVCRKCAPKQHLAMCLGLERLQPEGRERLPSPQCRLVAKTALHQRKEAVRHLRLVPPETRTSVCSSNRCSICLAGELQVQERSWHLHWRKWSANLTSSQGHCTFLNKESVWMKNQCPIASNSSKRPEKPVKVAPLRSNRNLRLEWWRRSCKASNRCAMISTNSKIWLKVCKMDSSTQSIKCRIKSETSCWVARR